MWRQVDRAPRRWPALVWKRTTSLTGQLFIQALVNGIGLTIIAGLAGLGAGLFEVSVIRRANLARTTVSPSLSEAQRRRERDAWRRFVRSVLAD
ncbi:MAG: hypothetical protein C4289_00150 [Chloroflexota bacterium]